MIKKIFILLILISFLIFSPNIVRAEWSCTAQSPPGCSLGDDCPAGYSCQTNYSVGGCTCQPNCKQNSLSCTTNTECCSGNCADGTCAAACKDNGSTCSANDDCCSGYCGDGICATPPPSASATPTQEPCDTDGNNTCDGGSTYCQNVCQEANPGFSIVHCYTSVSCFISNVHRAIASK